ncbi:hypothetical protein K3495_g67 [Podosphaera aphanis]|nr:hypothetical protein K3495_g67 [Podosphaera aphanis]
MLNAALNKKLRKASVTVKLPPAHNYQAFVAELKEVAGKLMALSDYKPKGSTRTFTKLGAPKSGNSLFSKTGAQPVEDVDIIMGGTNALVASISNLVHSRLEEKLSGLDASKDKKRDNIKGGTRKPQAPWCSREEFRKLVDKRVCVHCTKLGNVGLECSNLEWQRNPKLE